MQLVYGLVQAVSSGSPMSKPTMPLNLFLVIDNSSSMRGDRLSQVKEASRRIIDKMGEKDHLALITFNDNADLIIPLQRISDKASLKSKIDLIDAAGGTEMSNGLHRTMVEMQRAILTNSRTHIILLTDGKTYGDEDRCIKLVRKQQERNIGITALGIGDEWNEDLLQTLAAGPNSRTHYITAAQDITRVFTEEVQRISAIFAQDVQCLIEARNAISLRAFDRIQPYIESIDMKTDHDLRWFCNLGDWPDTDTQAFLLEIVIPPLDIGTHNLLRFTLRYHLPHAQNQQSDTTLQATVQEQAPEDLVDETSPIKHWLERLTAYRLQERAWKNVATGMIQEATRQLEMAGTRLFEAGDIELAQTVQTEAQRLSDSGQTSAEGRKRIQYGTRGLMKDSSH